MSNHGKAKDEVGRGQKPKWYDEKGVRMRGYLATVTGVRNDDEIGRRVFFMKIPR